MSAPAAVASGLMARLDWWYVVSLILGFWTLRTLALTVFHAFLGPLSRFPGPKSRALSIFPHAVSSWVGSEHSDLIALHEAYGPVVRTAPNQLSIIGNGQSWKDIYGFRPPGQPEAAKDPLFYGELMNRAPGLIMTDIPTHSRQRKIVSHAFSDRALKEQEPMFRTWAKKLRSRLVQDSARSDSIDLLSRYNFTTFDIMGDLTFAEPLHMLDNSEYVPWVRTIFDGIKVGIRIRTLRYLGSLPQIFLRDVLVKVPTVKKMMNKHFRYTADRLDRRLSKTPDRPDLWTRILERSKNADKGGLSLDEQYSIASLFMIAGTETTATALAGTTYNLLKSPSYLHSLQKELRAKFNSIDELTLEALARVPLLEACLREGIRMYPPVPTGLPRKTPPGGLVVDGRAVPGNVSVTIPQLATYRAESNWKHPESFRPERWLADPEFKNDRLDAFEPFSVGPRNCLGKNLAWHEMRLLLATVLLDFDLQLCEESREWHIQKTFSLWEKRPLLCKITPVATGR